MFVRASCFLILHCLHRLLVVLTGKCFPTSRSRMSSGTPLTPGSFFFKPDLHLLFISRPTVNCLTRASWNESWSRWPSLLQIHIINLLTLARSMRMQSRRCHHLSKGLPIAYLSRLWSKRSTPPIIALYSATAAEQGIIDDVPSLFFHFTEVTCLGWQIIPGIVVRGKDCHVCCPATLLLPHILYSETWILRAASNHFSWEYLAAPSCFL